MVAYFSGKDVHPLGPQDFPRMCKKYTPFLLGIARIHYYFSSIVSFYDFPAAFLNTFAMPASSMPAAASMFVPVQCAFIVIICSS